MRKFPDLLISAYCFPSNLNKLIHKRIGVLSLFLSVLAVFEVYSQSKIEVGSWRVHPTYSEGGDLTGSDQTVFFQGENSLFYFSTDNDEPKPLSVMDGLYSQSFTASVYDFQSKKLIVTYEDGVVDLVGERNVQSLTSIRDNPLILNKKIIHARSIDGLVYLTGDFGVAVIDPAIGAFRDSYINIGPEGSELEILDIDKEGDFYYLATALGLLQGNINTNLNDFRNWVNQGLDLAGGVKEVQVLEGEVFLSDTDGRIYIFKNGNLDWLIGTENSGRLKKINGELFFTDGASIYQLFSGGSFSQILKREDNSIFDFHITGNNIYLSQEAGVFNQNSENFISPNGPFSQIRNFHWDENGTWGLPVFLPVRSNAVRSIGNKTSVLKDGKWEAAIAPSHVMSKAVFQGDNYFGAFENGLWIESNGNLEKIDIPELSPTASIRSFANQNDNSLWIGANDNLGRLLKLSSKNQITTVPVAGLQYPHKIISDQSGNLWILQAPPNGSPRIRVFNENTGLNRLLNNSSNQGNLPNSETLDMDLDLEGNLWIATSSGVAYLPFVQFTTINNPINAILPIFDNRPLLIGQRVKSVLVAPDQTKWFGTEREGLWQFSELGDILLNQFTGNNSPLTSPDIQNTTLEPFSGEILITQSNAAFSFRGTSISAFESLNSLKIYPNPVRPDFSGYLSIEGLTDFAQIKITTSAGRVVFGAQVRGGKATWDLREGSGNRPEAGIYLVYVSDESGVEKVAGKFVIL
jgi:hypothetical protein